MSQEASISAGGPRATPQHMMEHSYHALWPSETMAKPLHIQRVEEALRLEPLLAYVEALNKTPVYSDQELSSDTDGEPDRPKLMDPIHYAKDVDGNRIYNGVVISKAERKADKCRLYNFNRVKKNRKWLKNVLLSDTSSDEDDDERPLTDADLKNMLKEHLWRKKHQKRFAREKDTLSQYQYYSVGLLSEHDKFYEHQKLFAGASKRRLTDEEKAAKKLLKTKTKNQKQQQAEELAPEIKEEVLSDGETSKLPNHLLASSTPLVAPTSTGKAVKTKVKKLTPEQIAAKRRRLWVMIMKKEIPRAQKQKAAARKEGLACIKKVAKECQKECRRSALLSQKTVKDAATRARRLSKEMQAYWKRFEKVEKEHRRKAEKEALEQRKMDMEMREMKRQQRKLNFLITQTELYAHFMARKLTGSSDADRDAILQHFDEPKLIRQIVAAGVVPLVPLEDDYDSEEMKTLALGNAEAAFESHQSQKQTFDLELKRSRNFTASERESAFSNPSISTAAERPQPDIFEGKLKCYQLKGMNWLANLYDQGINGILADEMGLGKTVQSIAFLAHLAESLQIWGPFLVIAPASTLHNWQQEVSKFVPQFKVVPYWGNTQDRRILRKFWSHDHMHMKEASFHIVITSYQLIVQDIKYFQRIKWHYMILDEAQAIKSSSSARWKLLLSFNCRNRLLLTGTPIQNSMAELWALLHFIMPTLFDSHDEFTEWFAKDIESHAEKQSGIDENQLSRLHMILKPFMLRRVKKDVENELSDKIEVLVYCPLTLRQKLLYQAIKNKISIEDLLQSSTATSSSQSGSAASSLMNLVMQFRKVCNHPDLFERREIRSPFHLRLPPFSLPKLVYREAVLDTALPSHRHLLYNKFNIFTANYVHQSLFSRQESKRSNCFSFTRFIDLSPADVEAIVLVSLCARWLAVIRYLEKLHVIHHQRQYTVKPISTRYLNKESLILEADRICSMPSLHSSDNLRGLAFCRHDSTTYVHSNVTLHCMAETQEHRRIRLRHAAKRHEAASGMTSPKRVPTSPPPSSFVQSPTKLHHHHHHHSYHTIFPHVQRPPVVIPCLPLDLPSFLYYTVPKTCATYRDYYCSDRSAAWQHRADSLCGSRVAQSCVLYGNTDTEECTKNSMQYFFPVSPGGLAAVNPKHGFSFISIPDKETLVTDGGKLFVLDKLLSRLKAEDHRILIYSQMTRMIDILEEYLWYRKHTYMRLDGSSKIADRRDMVADFQTRSDIFVFLLSTRAGGLGINLTAADTVIFYDSDWNPTVDQQAMDRAHRLGQTKQVTVYRLICKGTIEERIVQRATEKSEIQRMVISGGSFAPDILKPKEVVSLLLDDDEMERKLQQKQEEKRQKEELCKEKDRERKRKVCNTDKPKSGRGPGRPPKKAKIEEIIVDENVTIPALFDDSTTVSVGSVSTPVASPHSEVSTVSELTRQSGNIVTDDESLDGLVIVDDLQCSVSPAMMQPVAATSVKRGTGRSRGRPRGSGVSLRSRGPGSIRQSLVAAEAAAATAAKTAAYAAYGYSFTGERSGSSSRADSPTIRPVNGTSVSSAPSPASHTSTGSRR